MCLFFLRRCDLLPSEISPCAVRDWASLKDIATEDKAIGRLKVHCLKKFSIFRDRSRNCLEAGVNAEILARR
jgi:hypothetical protein